jgi:uncharacterized membrane protein YgaE (UPF0421/DUF939 family)
MHPIIYSNNEISRQISNAVLNIISLVIIIYFSRSLLSNPIICFFFSFVFSFVVVGFLMSFYASKINEISSDDFQVPVINEDEYFNRQKNVLKSVSKDDEKKKYKNLLRKFKNLRKEFRTTKNEIDDIKKELYVSKEYERPTTVSDAESTYLEPEIITDLDLNQEFVDNIRDIPADEILDDILNQTENNFELIQKT